jgi:hypothetical protein
MIGLIATLALDRTVSFLYVITSAVESVFSDAMPCSLANTCNTDVSEKHISSVFRVK